MRIRQFIIVQKNEYKVNNCFEIKMGNSILLELKTNEDNMNLI